MIFTPDYDKLVKQQKLAGAAVDELLEKSPIKERLANVEMDISNEMDGKPDTSSGKKGAVVHIEDIDIGGDGAEEKKAALSKAAPLSLVPLPQGMPDPDGEIAKWIAYARNYSARHVKLVVAPPSSSAIRTAILESAFGKMLQVATNAPLGQNSYIGVLYDTKAAGEASARAHLRICPFRDDYCTNSVKGSVAAGMEMTNDKDTDYIPSGFAYFMLNGHVHGHEGRLMKGFTNSAGKLLGKQKRLIFHATTEESEKLAKDRISGTGTINTIEFCWIVTRNELSVPEKKQLHATNRSNRSDTIGPFDRPVKNTPGIMMVG